MYHSSFKVSLMVSILALTTFSYAFAAEDEMPLEMGGKRQREIKMEKADTADTIELKRQRMEQRAIPLPQNDLEEKKAKAKILTSLGQQRVFSQVIDPSIPTNLLIKIEPTKEAELPILPNTSNTGYKDGMRRPFVYSDDLIPAMDLIKEKKYEEASHFLNHLRIKEETTLLDRLYASYEIAKLHASHRISSRFFSDNETYGILEKISRENHWDIPLEERCLANFLKAKMHVERRTNAISDEETVSILNYISQVCPRNTILPFWANFYKARMHMENRTRSISNREAFTFFNDMMLHPEAIPSLKASAKLFMAMMRFQERVKEEDMSDSEAARIFQESMTSEFFSPSQQARSAFNFAVLNYVGRDKSIKDLEIFKLFDSISIDMRLPLLSPVCVHADIYRARMALDGRTQNLTQENAIFLLYYFENNISVPSNLREEASRLIANHYNKTQTQKNPSN